jgi:hypothetical protein
MAKGCFTVGFNVEAKACITKDKYDLRGMGAYFTVKSIQNLETDSIMVFLGVPIGTDQYVVKQLVDEVREALGLKLMKKDTINGTTCWHGRSKWVEYEITKLFPFGMPLEKFDDIK